MNLKAKLLYKKLLACLLGAAFAALIAACSGAASQAPAPAGADESVQKATPETVAALNAGRVTLTTPISSEPPTLDPALVEDTTSNFFIRQMFIGLTKFNQDSRPVPELAASWSVSDDGLVWTFYLRDDISWVRRQPQTGEFETIRPVTAHDVVYGLRRTLHPQTASNYAYVLYPIAGAEALNSAAPDAENLDDLVAALGVNAVDETTVEFTLVAPVVYFSSIVALPAAYPQPREAIERWGDRWTEPGLIITNGPYTLREWRHDESMLLEKNPFWLNAGQVQIELFGGPIITEETTAFTLYEQNKLDMLASPGWGPPIQELDRIRADAQLSRQLYTAPRPCTYYYGFITTRPPFDDARVRRAFSIAIDREYLVNEIFKGGQMPAHSFAPPGVFGTVAGDAEIGAALLAGDAARLAEAQSLLADAGYPDGQGIDILISYNQSEGHTRITQEIQAMWQQAFPEARIEIKSQDWTEYLVTLRPDTPDEAKPHIYRAGWCADYLDSNNWLNDVFNSKSSSNWAKFNNPAYDALVEQAAFEADPEIRLELYRQAERILIDEQAIIAPIFYYTYVRLYKPWVKPVISPIGADPIAEWRIDVEAQQAAQR